MYANSKHGRAIALTQGKNNILTKAASQQCDFIFFSFSARHNIIMWQKTTPLVSGTMAKSCHVTITDLSSSFQMNVYTFGW